MVNNGDAIESLQEPTDSRDNEGPQTTVHVTNHGLAIEVTEEPTASRVGSSANNRTRGHNSSRAAEQPVQNGGHSSTHEQDRDQESVYSDQYDNIDYASIWEATRGGSGYSEGPSNGDTYKRESRH